MTSSHLHGCLFTEPLCRSRLQNLVPLLHACVTVCLLVRNLQRSGHSCYIINNYVKKSSFASSGGELWLAGTLAQYSRSILSHLQMFQNCMHYLASWCRHFKLPYCGNKMASNVIIQLPCISIKVTSVGQLRWSDGRMVTCIMTFPWLADSICYDIPNLKSPLSAVLLLFQYTPTKQEKSIHPKIKVCQIRHTLSKWIHLSNQIIFWISHLFQVCNMLTHFSLLTQMWILHFWRHHLKLMPNQGNKNWCSYCNYTKLTLYCGKNVI